MCVDWINSIDEPRCLIMNNFDELNDGLIILDILKNLIKKLNIFEEYFYEFIRLSKLKVYPKERFESVLNILGRLFITDEINDIIEINEKDFNVNYIIYKFLS